MAYGYQEGRLCGGFKKTKKLWLQILFSDEKTPSLITLMNDTLGNWIESMQEALQDSLTLLPTSNDEQQEKYVKHEVKTQIPPSTEWGNL